MDLKSELNTALLEADDRSHREQIWFKLSTVADTLEVLERVTTWYEQVSDGAREFDDIMDSVGGIEMEAPIILKPGNKGGNAKSDEFSARASLRVV